MELIFQDASTSLRTFLEKLWERVGAQLPCTFGNEHETWQQAALCQIGEIHLSFHRGSVRFPGIPLGQRCLENRWDFMASDLFASCSSICSPCLAFLPLVLPSALPLCVPASPLLSRREEVRLLTRRTQCLQSSGSTTQNSLTSRGIMLSRS